MLYTGLRDFEASYIQELIVLPQTSSQKYNAHWSQCGIGGYSPHIQAVRSKNHMWSKVLVAPLLADDVK